MPFSFSYKNEIVFGNSIFGQICRASNLFFQRLRHFLDFFPHAEQIASPEKAQFFRRVASFKQFYGKGLHFGNIFQANDSAAPVEIGS